MVAPDVRLNGGLSRCQLALELSGFQSLWLGVSDLRRTRVLVEAEVSRRVRSRHLFFSSGSQAQPIHFLNQGRALEIQQFCSSVLIISADLQTLLNDLFFQLRYPDL